MNIYSMIVECIIFLKNIYYYFPSINAAHYDCIRNSFIKVAIDSSLILKARSNDCRLMIINKKLSFGDFWIFMKQEHTSLAENHLPHFYNFPSHIYFNPHHNNSEM